MSRRKIEFDEALIADLAFRGASNRDIAAHMGCDESTVRDRFPALLHKKRAERRMGIRDAQTAAMREGNATMLVWLGKQELEQTDKVVALVGEAPKPTLEDVRNAIRKRRRPGPV